MIFQVKPPVKPPFIRDFRWPATFDYRLMPRMSIEEAQWPTQLVWISWRGSKLGYLWIHICDICLHGGLSKNMVALNPLICIGLPSYIYIYTHIFHMIWWYTPCSDASTYVLGSIEVDLRRPKHSLHHSFWHQKTATHFLVRFIRCGSL